MGFFNDIIADARPAPESVGESFNTGLNNPERPFDEELRPVFPDPMPVPVDKSEDTSPRREEPSSRFLGREVKGEVTPPRLMATEPFADEKNQNGSTSRHEKPAGKSSFGAPARGGSVESRQLNGDEENGGPIRERMLDPSSVSLKGEGLSTSSSDRDSVASTVAPKTGSVSKGTSIEGQTSDPLPEPGPVENSVEAMAKNPAGRKPQPEPVEQANNRQFSRETRVESSTESPKTIEDQVGSEGAPSGLRTVEVELTSHEPSREQRAVKAESSFDEKGERAVSITAMTQPPAAEESLSPPPTLSTDEEQTENQESFAPAAAFPETAASPPAEGKMPEPMGQEPPSQPQVSIGRIEVIVEVSDPPAAEKAVKSGALSQDLSSRYYLRRL